MIFYEEVYQVSIMVTDINRSVDLQDQISRITESGNTKYKVVYPYDSSPLYDFEETFKILATIGMLILTAVTIIASSFLSYIIFKAIINTKLRDYSIFRTIGANQRVVRSFIYIENFIVFIIAYIIFLIISLTLPNKIPGFTLFDSLGVYSFLDYVMYFILLSLMSIFISQRYCNKIFQYSVSKTLKTELE